MQTVNRMTTTENYYKLSLFLSISCSHKRLGATSSNGGYLTCNKKDRENGSHIIFGNPGGPVVGLAVGN